VTDPLAIYLNDHLAGATVGRELVRRTLRSNRGTEFEPLLAWLAREIDEDREQLVQAIDRLGFRRDRLKVGLAWLGEKLGRLKPNGQLAGYSPLSRVVEFEALSAGIQAKLSLWRALAALDGHSSAAFESPLDALVERAEAQHDRLEQARLRAVELALTASVRNTPESS
jgi:hypothetical protein